MKEIYLESKEYIGLKAGQDAYKSLSKELSQEGNLVIFPPDVEILPSFIRGFMGIRDDNLYIKLCSENPETQEFLSKWEKEFEHLRGDSLIPDPPKNKKK